MEDTVRDQLASQTQLNKKVGKHGIVENEVDANIAKGDYEFETSDYETSDISFSSGGGGSDDSPIRGGGRDDSPLHGGGRDDSPNDVGERGGSHIRDGERGNSSGLEGGSYDNPIHSGGRNDWIEHVGDNSPIQFLSSKVYVSTENIDGSVFDKLNLQVQRQSPRLPRKEKTTFTLDPGHHSLGYLDDLGFEPVKVSSPEPPEEDILSELRVPGAEINRVAYVTNVNLSSVCLCCKGQQARRCSLNVDLQLAAELGKTLLERNRELENSIKHHQAVIDDQGQEIEYLTKQTSALREVNESRVRVYEQLEISLQEAENLNVRLQEEAASDKARIKSLVGIVENLEQKCEDLQALTQENRNQDELSSFFRAESREKSGAAAPTKPRKHSFIQHPRSPERRLNPDHPTDLRPSHCPSSSLGCGSSSSTNEGLSNLELEILELNSELERMRDLRDQEAKRMLDLQLQVGGLVGENISLSRSLEEANTQSTADHNTDSGSGPTCLCAEVRKATCANQMKRDPIHNPANTDLKLKNIPVERQICEARRPSPGLEHQPNLVQDVKEVHRPSHVKDVKDVKDVKVAKVVKDVKDIKDVEDVKDVEDFEDVMVENAEYVPQPNHVESFMENQVKPNKVQEPLTSEGEKLPSYEKNFRVKTANGKQLPQANEQLRDEEQLYDEEQIPAKEQLPQANEQLCDEQIPAKEQLPQANEQLPDEEQLPAKEQLEDSTAVAFNDVKDGDNYPQLILENENKDDKNSGINQKHLTNTKDGNNKKDFLPIHTKDEIADDNQELNQNINKVQDKKNGLKNNDKIFENKNRKSHLNTMIKEETQKCWNKTELTEEEGSRYRSLEPKPNFKIGLLVDLEDADEDRVHSNIIQVGLDDNVGDGVETLNLQEELKMSGQYSPESCDTLSSGFSDSSENKYCTRETQTDKGDKGHIKLGPHDVPEELPFSASPPTYRQIFREMFRVLDDAKKKPLVALKPRPRRRTNSGFNPQTKNIRNTRKADGGDDFPRLTEETPGGTARSGQNSYAEILRKGIVAKKI